jgi:hypothetical protein
MKLREHPRVMGRWPPSDGDGIEITQFAPVDCMDVLETAHYMGTTGRGLPGIALETVYAEKRLVRKFFIYDRWFAKELTKFLREHKGSTVRELGELDVTFEFLPYVV